MKKLRLLLAALAAAVGLGANATDWTGSTVGAGTYYLYNVGAGQFLSTVPNGWGTQAGLDNVGLDVTLASSGTGYSIDTQISNGGEDHYLKADWTDQGAQAWTFTKVSDSPVTYTINNGTGNLAFSGTKGTALQVNNEAGANAQWILVTKAERIAALSYASKSSPVDATFLIKDNSFSRNNTRNSAWTKTWSGGDNKLAAGGNNGNMCMESYHTNNFEVKQDIADAPAGIYGLKAQGFYRQDGTNTSYPYFYINDQQVTFPVRTGSENSMGDASTSFSNGLYFSDEARYTYASGTFTVGAKLVENGQLWSIFDNFQLTYYGADASSSLSNPTFDSNADGWEGSKAAQGSNEGEFFGGDSSPYNTFDMYQSVNSLANGIYAVEVQAFYRSGSDGGYGAPNEKRAKNAEVLYPELYATAGGATRSVILLSMYDEAGNCGSTGADSPFGKIPQDMAQAQTFFQAGLYTDNKVIVEVTDGTLTLGLRKTTGLKRDWTLFDNFSLTKLGYSTLAEAYAAEWSSKKTAATNVLNDVAYAVIPEGDPARTGLATALTATPADVDSYVSALAALRSAVNGFKASKYAYSQFATVFQPAIDAESTTYAHVTGTEKTNFDTNVVNAVPSTKTAEAYYNFVTAQTATVNAFTAAKHSYNEYFYENETATRLGADVSSVTAPTTADEAATAAHAINVINYNFLNTKGYEDVSTTVLGTWVDDNVGSRTGQHYDGTTTSGYFEQNEGWNQTAWSMSRQQTVALSAGAYVLKVAARASANADAELSVTVGDGTPIVTYVGHHGDSGKGITTEGAASYNEGTFANENNGRGFEWRYIPFTLAEDGQVTLKFYAHNTDNAKWQFVSFTSLGIWTDPAVAAKTDLLTAINTATSVKDAKAGNVGTGIFQIPESAQTTLSSAISTAQNVYDNTSATKDEVIAATTAINTAVTTYQNTQLNAPAADKRYYLNIQEAGKAWDGNAITFIAGGRTDQGNYAIKYLAPANAYMNQALKLTAVEGKANTYKVSVLNANGEEQYLTTGTTYGGNNEQIRVTDDASKAMEIKILAASTSNQFQLFNVAANKVLANNNNNDLFTANSANFTIAEATQASVTATAKAGKFGTVVFPFVPEVAANANVTFYTVTGVEGESVQLAEAETLAANTPYLIKNTGSEDYSETLTGWGLATADKVDGKLTGVYTAQTIAASVEATADAAGELRYVLQTQGETQAFYKVDADFTATAYKCFLTVSVAKTGSEVKAFYLDFGGADAIEGITADSIQNAAIYNLAGQRVNKAQKGLYIVGGKKVVIK